MQNKLERFLSEETGEEALTRGMDALSNLLLSLPDDIDLDALERAANNIRPTSKRAKVKASRRANNQRKQICKRG